MFSSWLNIVTVDDPVSKTEENERYKIGFHFDVTSLVDDPLTTVIILFVY